MSRHFRITVRFLQSTSHGRGERGEPEWPPSPLRLFQTLVAAAAARWNERTRLETVAPALRWLESLPAPTIIASVGVASAAKFRLYVPDNVGDLVAGSWSRGGTQSIADYRTEKDVCPIQLEGEDPAVHYLWDIDGPDIEDHLEILIDAVRSITHLGWGVDMVAADAMVLSDAESGRMPGERWQPVEDAGRTGYRVAVAGTLDALLEKYDAFLDRVGREGFRPVPPLSTFRVVGYRRTIDPPRREVAAFKLCKLEADAYQPFDPIRRGMEVSGMMRHAAKSMQHALGWPDERVANFVLGHGEKDGELHVPVRGPRLAFIPLPSIEHRRERGWVAGSIRRVLITVYNGEADEDLRRLAQYLSGAELIEEDRGRATALIAQIQNPNTVLRRYCEPAATWATVTPVILPGHDDPRKIRQRLRRSCEPRGAAPDAEEQHRGLAKLDARIEHLLRKAIRQAGFSDDLADHAEIEWRSVGFWPGTEPATRYAFPNQLRRFRRLHVRITWRDPGGRKIPIPGPVCLGGGRFCGLGLFASINS